MCRIYTCVTCAKCILQVFYTCNTGVWICNRPKTPYMYYMCITHVIHMWHISKSSARNIKYVSESLYLNNDVCSCNKMALYYSGVLGRHWDFETLVQILIFFNSISTHYITLYIIITVWKCHMVFKLYHVFCQMTKNTNISVQ